ncbi:hypothetical protein [Aneurinibacillus sp. REN35]|uniref:hypothetical protein n=1 Tax=Aneurinibacillus sp. REN35 TaxID=3237286 RepID=UPI00352994FE
MFRYMVFYKEEEGGHDFTFVEADSLTQAVEEAYASLPQQVVITDIGQVGCGRS